MSAPAVSLAGFAYGEDLDGPQQRSLGFRLLAPSEPQPWCAEVEALARALQSAPYPEQWPPTELFCSVVLADGQRLVAVARYGLADHTPSRRRSGLELIGVAGPGNLTVAQTLALYHWLRQRRADGDDLRALGGRFALDEVLATVPAQQPANNPLPVLPIRLWQEGALLFAATAPSDADRCLGLLEQGTASTWQWLPLVGADFPLAQYAQRGPLVAWTPHLAGVAVKLDRKAAETSPLAAPSRRVLMGTAALLALLLLAANLWSTLALSDRLAQNQSNVRSTPATALAPVVATDATRERFAQSLHQLLRKRGAITDGNHAQLLGIYESAAGEVEGLRVSGTDGQAAIGAICVLSRASPAQVELLVREALSGRGYDPALIERACQMVRERLGAAPKGSR